MRVSRLEIFGFKSFVDRFLLNFDKNIIGIVGPNGCGKSNVVDALRWVLGETHARQLRGSLLEDLIFNGSQSRRPLGMAEVSITVRPDAGWRPATIARLSEIYDSPEDAEEEEGEISSLLDIPGLFEAAEIQLTRRLYRSGESEYFINRVPCRLRDMTEFYQLIGLGARGLSIVQQGQIGDIVMRKPLERRELLEEAAGIAGFRVRIEAAQRKLEKTRDNIARLKDITTEVEKQVRLLSRQAKRARERGALKEELQQRELELFSARAALVGARKEEAAREERTVSEQLDAKRRAQLSLSAVEEESRAGLEIVDAELADARAAREGILTALGERRARENDAKLAAARFEGRVQAVDGERRRIEAQRQGLEAERARRAGALEELIASLTVLRGKKEAAEERLRALADGPVNVSQSDAERLKESEVLTQEGAAIEERLNRLGELSAAIAEAEHTVHSRREQLERKRNAMNDQRVRSAGLESEARSLRAQLGALADQMKERFGAGSDESFSGRVLLAGITAPAELQRPLAAVLGEKASYLVSPDGATLREHYLSRQHELHRSQLGVIDQGGAFGGEEVSCEATRLVDLIDVAAEFEGVVSALLRNVFYVDSIARAFELAHLEPRAVFVTPLGEVVCGWGWYTTEGQGFSFSFTRLIEERERELAGLRDELASAQSQLDSLAGELARAEEQRERMVAEKEELLSLEKRLSIIHRELADIERFRRLLAQEEERQAQTELRTVAAELSAVQRSVTFERERCTAIEGELGQLGDEAERLVVEERLLRHEREESLAALTSAAPDTEVAQCAAELVRSEGQLKAIEEHRQQVKSRLSQVAHDLELARREADALRTAQQEKTLVVERCSLELGMLLDEARRRFGEALELPSAAECARIAAGDLTARIGELEREVSTLGQRLEREGEVDPQSIPLHEQEKKRLESMQDQLEDLMAAAETLARSIRHLEEISRERFIDTFRDVQEKFEALVPRLFGGGAGHLALINPDDPLGSGVEITVRPPGKKIRSMELLSGGEKALAATAILIAMFLHRPSPICVLDEVDAPLDDANVERFLDLVREISGTTQFLIITHNKQTMSACDRLLGITMQESGVTKALSVSFEEASEELEKMASNQ